MLFWFHIFTSDGTLAITNSIEINKDRLFVEINNDSNSMVKKEKA